jgi:L-ascorbate metabolism protein UlaG (beta-lactamase superfamily)
LQTSDIAIVFSLNSSVLVLNSKKAFSRRAFITGLAATAAVSWGYDSQSLSARVLRGVVDDANRPVSHPRVPDISKWSDSTIDMCWIGHATMLINFYGLKLVTDPVLYDRVGASTPLGTFGRKRLVAPALSPKQFPKVDLVLQSHAHMDHFDFPSLDLFSKSAPIVTAAETTDLAKEAGFKNVSELRWGQKKVVKTKAGDIELEAFHVNHWGARWKVDSYRGYNGYLLTRGGKTILFGGDTAMCDSFSQLSGRKIEAAIMPIGCYGRGGSHCTPEQSVKMTDACNAPYIIPIHHSTFPIGKEPLAEPMMRLRETISEDRIAIQEIGGTWTLPA